MHKGRVLWIIKWVSRLECRERQVRETEADVSILMGIARYSKPVTIDEEDGKTTRLGGTIVQGRMALALVSGLILKSDLWTAK